MTQKRKPQDTHPRDGKVLEWQLWDEQGKPCARGLSREKARELRGFAGGFIAKVVRTH